ncbi:DUF4167 domain-containing protein [Hansschlegelia sp. KR7-227]|uniref:DUF4167 domain-containing protein n=1 Tax=Hansschlegelia sp. KR7-227 TaxID=3400914 RepID=UPI003C05C54A
MRQGQSKRLRGRGRGGSGGGGGGGGGGSGGKGPNPLNRSYESNGPDVKIRGNAATIADKYVQLSRDALTAGDPVSAENYMQHAEHYYRLLAAAQAQFQPHQTFVRADADDYNDPDFDEDNADGAGEANSQPQAQPQPQSNGAPQPYRNDQPPRPNGDQGRSNGGYAQPGRDGERRFDRNERNDRTNDRRDSRSDRPGGRFENRDRAAAPRSEEQPALSELPAFITAGAPPSVAEEAPKPRSKPESKPEAVAPEAVAVEAAAAPDTAVDAPASTDDDAPAPSSRGRRRRYGRYGRSASGEEDAAEPSPQPTADAPSD